MLQGIAATSLEAMNPPVKSATFLHSVAAYLMVRLRESDTVCCAGGVADAQGVMAARRTAAEAAVMAALKGQLACFQACHCMHAGPSAPHSHIVPEHVPEHCSRILCCP